MHGCTIRKLSSNTQVNGVYGIRSVNMHAPVHSTAGRARVHISAASLLYARNRAKVFHMFNDPRELE